MYHTTPIAIVPQAGSYAALQTATVLAESIGGLVLAEDEPDRLRLYVTDERISLIGPREMGLGGVSVEFSHVVTQMGGGHLSRKQPLGRAFQVRDDILDVETDTATLGKPQGSDERRAKATFPALLGLDGAKRRVAELRAEARAALEPFGADADPLRWMAAYIVDRAY
jgi:hypothetical protein